MRRYDTMEDGKKKIVVDRIKNASSYNETLEKIRADITGFSTKITNIIDASGDIGEDIRDYLSNTYDVRGQVRDIMRITGKDSATGSDMKDSVGEVFKEIAETNAPNMNQSKLISMLKEYNYMVSNMPQLTDSIKKRVTDILSPDSFAKLAINFTIEDSGNSQITNQEIKTIFKERKLGREIRDSLMDGHQLGIRYVYVFPSGYVADTIKERMGLKDLPKSTKSKRKRGAKRKKIPSNRLNLFGATVLPDNTSEKTVSRDMMSADESGIKMYTETFTEGNENPDVGVVKTITDDDFFKHVKAALSDNDATTSKLFGEAYGLACEDADNKIEGYSTSPITDEAKSALYQMYKETISDAKLYGESIDHKSFNGCFVGTLDADKCAPVIVNKEIVGVWYTEEDNDGVSSRVGGGIGNNINSAGLRDNALDDDIANSLMQQQTYDKLYDVIRRNMDMGFMKDNTHILEAIDNIVRSSTIGKANCKAKVRFIPREYFVPFVIKKDGKGFPVSSLHSARVPAHYWIMLSQSSLYNKMYNSKDKTVAYMRMGLGTQIDRQVERAAKSLKRVYPRPSEIFNLRKTHVAMLEGDKLVAPMTSDGQKGVQFDRLQGMKEEENFDLMETMEAIATGAVGVETTLTSKNNREDLATPILSADGRSVREAISEQDVVNDIISELITKIVRCDKGDYDINITANLPEPKALSDKIFEDNIEKIERRVDKMISFEYGEDWSSIDEAKGVRRLVLRHETDAILDHELLEKCKQEYKTEEADKVNNNDGEDEAY